jgi:pimeloyl-ACP methyl ester carboxylesterase
MAGLTACNLSSTADNDAVATDPILAGQAGQVPSTVTPLFNPARAQLPLATDFLFSFPRNSDTGLPVNSEDADGTLYRAEAYTTNSDGDRVLIGVGEEGYNPVISALNDMDGFSINAEIDIPLSGDVDAATIILGKNVILVPLNYDDPITGDLVAGESPFKTEFSDFTVSTVKYATPEGDASKYALRVNLTKPLASKTRYLVIIANDGDDAITDIAGKAIEMPNQYRALAGDGVLLSAALAPARDAVQSWTALAKGYLGAKQQDTEGLVMAYTLTTGGGIEVLSTMAAPGNSNSALQQNPTFRAIVAAAPDAATAIGDLQTAGLTLEQAQGTYGLAVNLQTPGPRTVSLPAAAGPGLNIANFVPAFAGSTATVLTGSIDLPYYLEAPAGAYTGEDPVAAGYLCTPTGADDAACIARKTSAGNTIISQWSADDALATNLQNPALTPPSTNVTRLFPFAKKNGMRKAPVLVVKPSTPEPTAAGYPVIIYQHGIFGNRTNSLAVANQMAAAGFVTVAIDLPLHGVMPTDLITGTTTPIFASLLGAKGTDISGMDAATQALIIGGETVAERHFGLTNVESGFSPTAVSGTDASLNGSGSLFFNLIHLQTARDNSRQAVMDLLNLNASLGSFDIDGDADLTDIDVSQVHYIGHSLGGIIGTVFVATNNLNGLKVIGAGPTYLNPNGNAALPFISETVLGMPGSAIPRLLEASTSFAPAIKGPVTTPRELGGFGLTENSESYNQLFYVFQGSLDSADPASFAPAMSLIPGALAKYMVIESIGDKVVPNSATSPLAGTTPLAGLLGTNQIDGTSTAAELETGKYFVRFNDADSSHGSIASPGAEGVELSAFTEIVTLTTKLFMGLDPEITDSTVVSAAE